MAWHGFEFILGEGRKEFYCGEQRTRGQRTAEESKKQQQGGSWAAGAVGTVARDRIAAEASNGT
jgi:hypothetical protein